MSNDQKRGDPARRWDTWFNCFLLVIFVFFFFNLWQTVHDRWLVEREAGPGGVARIVDYHPEMIVTVIIGLVVVAAVFAARRPKQTWGFLASMRLGIIMIASVLVSTVFGTLVFQNAGPEQYVSFYSELFFALFRAVHFTNLFGSWWFLALCFLLAANLVACAVKRKAWRLSKLGFLMAHFGIVVVIIGMVIGGLFEVKGALVLGEGDSSSYAASQDFVDASGGDFAALAPELIPEEHRIPLGSTIRLDKFEELYYEDPFTVNVLEVVQEQMPGQEGRARESIRSVQTVEFKDTRPLVLKQNKGRLRIKKTYHHLRRSRVIEPSQEGRSLARVLFWSESQVQEQVLSEETLDNPIGGLSFRLRFTWNELSDEELERLGIASGSSPHKFVITNVQDEDIATIPLVPGGVAAIEGTEYNIALIDAYHDLAMRQENGETILYDASDQMRNPAARIRVSGGGIEPVTLTMPAFRSSPHNEQVQALAERTGLRIRYALDPPYELLIVGSTGELKIFGGGDEPQTIDPSVEGGFSPPLSGFFMRVTELVESGVLVDDSVAFDDSPVANPGVEVEVETPNGVLSGVLERSDNAMSFEAVRNERRYSIDLGDNWLVTLTVRGDYRKEWRANVTVLDGDQEVRKHVVRVNEPLVNNGFYYYQHSFAPSVPYGQTPDRWYTYLEVVNDPGLYLVYLGLAMLTLGIIYTFYIRPRFERRAEKKEDDYVE